MRRKDASGIHDRDEQTLAQPSEQPARPERRKDDARLRQSQAHLALQYGVSSILAASSTLFEALPLLLETVCTHLGWDAGAYWALDRDGAVLRCRTLWHRPALDVAPFEALSRQMTFARGVGLPGGVWASGSPMLVSDVADDTRLRRARLAAAVGLHGAVGLPVQRNVVLHGVMEFFSREVGNLGDDLVQALVALGAQVAQFVERVQMEEARRETETRRAAVVETALDAIVAMDHEGCIIEFNPAAERTFGYSRDMVMGRELADLIIPPQLRDRHRAGLARYLARGHGAVLGQRMEVTAMRADGSLFPAEVVIARIPLDGPPLFTGYIRDLTDRKRAEVALRTSEERLRTVVANAPIVLFAVDRDGVFTVTEGSGLDALGLKPGGHVGQSYFALYRDLPDGASTLRRVLSGEVATTINRYKGFVFETRWVPTTAADGTISGAIGVSTDITVRAWVEEERAALLERERRARADAVAEATERDAVFEAMTDGVFVFDRDGKTLRMNRAYRTLLALAPDDAALLRGYSLVERGAHMAMRDADGRTLPRAQWPVSRILRGEVLAGGDVDIMVRAGDGRDVFLSVSGAPLYDDRGGLVGGVCICRDMTERRRLERRTHEALEALLAMAQTLVLSADDAGHAQGSQAVARRVAELTRHVLGCERVSIMAVDHHTGAGHPLAVVGLSPEQERAWEAEAGRTPASDADSALIARIYAGEVFVLDLRQPPWRDRLNPLGVGAVLIAPMRVGDELVGILSLDYGGAEHTYREDELALAGAVAKLAALAIERERLLREREEARTSAAVLREANRRMDDFLGIAGHEMRTPLTTISGHIQLARRRVTRLGAQEGASADEMRRGLAAIEHFLARTDGRLARLARLVDDLVDVSRIQAGRLELRPGPGDLAAIVRAMVEERREAEPTRNIQLQGALGDTVSAHVDEERIGQVLDNYLSNALKYSPPDRPVTVGLDVEGEVARVWVRDEGAGVPPDDRDRVWDRFYRVAGLEHQHGSSVGLGLGLHISRTIVEQHGGRVGVDSAPGAGSVFWFTVPLTHPA